MGRYYAACVTTLGQYLRTPPEERSRWFSVLKRMSQVWVRLSHRSRPSTLALTGLGERGDDPARLVVDSTLLALLMARRLTGNAETLRRIAFSALVVDPSREATSQVASPELRRWNSGAECASAILGNAPTGDDATRRAVISFEIDRLFATDSPALPYDESVTPKVETMLVGIARKYTELFARRGSSNEGPRQVVESISKATRLRVEQYLLHLLVDTLGLFTRGMRVELSSGWRGVVLSSSDHVTGFHLPSVRLLRNPKGETVPSKDVDLSEELDRGDDYGYVVRRLEDIDDDTSEIKDSMTDSMRR